jgi:rare lipoprotein A
VSKRLWLGAFAFLAVACASPSRKAGAPVRGIASWYGKAFQGKKTASGELFDMHRLTAAHRSLPFGTVVRVRNPKNSREVRVRINDRGPYAAGRILDLSYEAARRLGLLAEGESPIELYIENAR